jgi:hypothetical protein
MGSKAHNKRHQTQQKTKRTTQQHHTSTLPDFRRDVLLQFSRVPRSAATCCFIDYARTQTAFKLLVALAFGRTLPLIKIHAAILRPGLFFKMHRSANDRLKCSWLSFQRYLSPVLRCGGPSFRGHAQTRGLAG